MTTLIYIKITPEVTMEEHLIYLIYSGTATVNGQNLTRALPENKTPNKPPWDKRPSRNPSLRRFYFLIPVEVLLMQL